MCKIFTMVLIILACYSAVHSSSFKSILSFHMWTKAANLKLLKKNLVKSLVYSLYPLNMTCVC